MSKTVEIGCVLSNREVASGVHRMSLALPQVAALVAPGQFVHVRVSDMPSVQFLRMPFCVCDADAAAGTAEIVYAVVGAGTGQLSRVRAGEHLDVIGPIGNGWSAPPDVRRALLVGGGVGAPALNLLAGQLATRGVRVDVALGAASAAALVCADELGAAARASGGELHIATDDGSAGAHGFVTQVSDPLVTSGDFDYIAVCGPAPMMRNVVRPALERGLSCQVSLEKLMACGVGACLSCVVETAGGRKRCCVDGPVFDAGEVVWR